MFTGSEDLDDLVKGYLKSGKVLESKLQQLSTLKNVIKVPGRASINEQPVEAEDEEESSILIGDGVSVIQKK